MTVVKVAIGTRAERKFLKSAAYDHFMRLSEKGRHRQALRFAFGHGYSAAKDEAGGTLTDPQKRRIAGKWYFLTGWLCALVFALVVDAWRVFL